MKYPKRFCSKCRWHETHSGDFGGWEYCTSPRNYSDTYLRPKDKAIKTPEERNGKNRCTLFAPKRTFIQWLNDLIT